MSLWRQERGMALVVAAMAMMLLLAIGATLIIVTSAETAIAGNFRTGGEASHAATAVVERTIAELRDVTDWTLPLSGAMTGAATDGPISAARHLSDGTVLDLSVLLNLANCGRRTPCTSTAMNLTTIARPWGVNNPRWRLFTYGWLDDLAGPPAQGSPFYVVAMVGDDGAENDGEPEVDGGTHGAVPNPGARVLLVRGEAFGPRGAHRGVEAVIAAYRMDELDPASPQRLHVRAWQEF